MDGKRKKEQNFSCDLIPGRQRLQLQVQMLMWVHLGSIGLQTIDLGLIPRETGADHCQNEIPLKVYQLRRIYQPSMKKERIQSAIFENKTVLSSD